MFKTKFTVGVCVYLPFKSYLIHDTAVDLCWGVESS